MTNSPTPQGAQEATDGRESASETAEEARDAQAATDAAEGHTAASALDARELRRALAFNAVGPALADHDEWLPLSVRQAVADAVLDAVDGATESDQPQQLLTRAESHAAAVEQIRTAASGLYATTGLRVLNALDQPQEQP